MRNRELESAKFPEIRDHPQPKVIICPAKARLIVRPSCRFPRRRSRTSCPNPHAFGAVNSGSNCCSRSCSLEENAPKNRCGHGYSFWRHYTSSRWPALASAALVDGTTLTLQIMTPAKLRLGVISALVVVGVATQLGLQHQAQIKLREQNLSLRQQVDQLAFVAAKNERLSNQLGQDQTPKPLSDEQFSELMRLRGEAGVQKNELAKLRAEFAANQNPPAIEPPSEAAPQKYFSKESWAQAGYATPEATIQSAFWAASHNDAKAVLACLSPEQQAQGEWLLKDKSESEIAAQHDDGAARDGKAKGPSYREQASGFRSRGCAYRIWRWYC